MSTVPGHDAWRDAGLDAPDEDEPVSLIEQVGVGAVVDPDEYQPVWARPDLAGHADEADVAEQAWTVPDLEDYE